MADPRFESDAKQVHEIAPWAYDQTNDRYKVSVDGATPVEVVVMDNVAKRDTAAVTSAWIPIDGLKTKRLITITTLDQGATINVHFSRDGVNQLVFAGGAKTVAANSGYGSYTESDPSFHSIKGFIRFAITFAVAPTSGNITVLFQGMSL